MDGHWTMEIEADWHLHDRPKRWTVTKNERIKRRIYMPTEDHKKRQTSRLSSIKMNRQKDRKV